MKINYYDLAAGDGAAFSIFGEALSDVRDEVMYQIHFGADYSKGTYGWTLDLDTVKRSVDKQLKDLRTDYINYGFIHCQDESKDWEKYQKNGILQYLLDMRGQGVVKHIGASSHTPSVIQEILDTDIIDMLMFSVNPAYDYNHGEYAYGGVDERADVYKRCEKLGVGISVMKPFSGGQLLNDEMESAFGVRPVKAVLGPDLLCIFDSEEQIRNMKPDQSKLADLPGRGQDVTAKGEDSDCVSRSFFPKLLVAEDPVCGSAHCQIADYWSKELGKLSIHAYQASKRGGHLYCEMLENGRIAISGEATLVAVSEIVVGD